MIVHLIWVMMQCHRIVSQACKDAKDMFKASHELAVLCAIGATLPADAEIDNLSLANIRKLGGVHFEAADTQFVPRKYRCSVVPAILHALAEEYRQASKNDDGMRSAAAMFTTLVAQRECATGGRLVRHWLSQAFHSRSCTTAQFVRHRATKHRQPCEHAVDQATAWQSPRAFESAARGEEHRCANTSAKLLKNPHQVEVVVVGLMIPFQLPESQA